MITKSADEIFDYSGLFISPILAPTAWDDINYSSETIKQYTRQIRSEE
jgi:hypothetical protein